MILQILAMGVLAFACTLLAAWSRYNLTTSLLYRILLYRNQPIPSRYALDELKFFSSVQEL